MKYIIFLFVLVMCTQCSNKQVLLSGKYGVYQDIRDYNYQIELFDDSTFIYKYLVGSRLERYSKGKWRYLDKKTVVLNSNIQDDLATNSVKIIPSKNKNSVICIDLTVQGKDPKGYICTPIFNDNYFAKISPLDRGVYCLYSEVPLEKAYFNIDKYPQTIEVLGMTQPTYKTIRSEDVNFKHKVGDSIIFNLQVSDSLFSYQVFKDKKLKIKGKNLMIDIAKDFEESKKYKLRLIE